MCVTDILHKSQKRYTPIHNHDLHTLTFLIKNTTSCIGTGLCWVFYKLIFTLTFNELYILHDTTLQPSGCCPNQYMGIIKAALFPEGPH